MVAEGTGHGGAAGLREDCLRVTEAASCEELLQQTVAFTRQLGFETVAAMVALDQPCGPTEFHTLHNTPPSYRDHFEDMDEGRRCPVMQYCKHSARPLAWNQHTYTAAGLGEMWEAQAAHGLRVGLAVAWHLPRGRHFFIGVDRDQALPACRIELSRLTAELQLFAAHAQEAALRLLDRRDTPAGRPGLTAREREALCWTMEGKTAWEAGRILGISEQTVARHLQNAARKLDAVNKHQAVIKALRLGLLN